MVQNIKLCNSLLEMIDTLNEAAFQLYEMVAQNSENAPSLMKTMQELLAKMQGPTGSLSEEEPALQADKLCRNTGASLSRVMILAGTDTQKCCRKIEFELIPIIQEFYVELYFWGLCYPDKEKMWRYYRDKMPELCPLPYVSEYEKSGEYPYEMSVVVVAYNHLNVTRNCIQALLENFPKEINHELILINNGSNDGTKEYFEGLHPDKQVDIACNTKSLSVIGRIVQGRYLLFISNDVVITPHAVENMLTCLKSDEKIGCVVPSCPNIANLQSIPADYKDLNDLKDFAQRNNVSDPYRWMQRARLNMPIAMIRSRTSEFYSFFIYLYPFHPDRFIAFSDDLATLLLRRAGYKNILAKDAYVHHFGSTTIGSKMEEFYREGRLKFRRIFGIDPWGTGLCYDFQLMQALPLPQTGPVNILGVNCGMGDTPLEIRNRLRENLHNTNVRIYNVTSDASYQEDLAGVSDEFVCVGNFDKTADCFFGTRFDYILVAGGVDMKIKPFKTIRKLYSRLTDHGILAVQCEDGAFINSAKGLFPDTKQTGKWVLITKTV